LPKKTVCKFIPVLENPAEFVVLTNRYKMKNFETVEVGIDNEVMTVALNRPGVHNAMNQQMIAELTEIFSREKHDKTVRCIVLRGNGKSFCAGADLNYMKNIAGFGYDENRRDGEKLAALFNAVYTSGVPTIALVHGAAFGGANGLLAACDIVIAAENAKFAFSEVKLGIAPATIAPFVIKRIGEYGAKELMITGRRFTGLEAEKWHLVNYALPAEVLEEKLNSIVDEIKTAAPGAVKAAKQLINKIVNDDTDVTRYTANLIAELRASAEGQEGMKAFFEKRKPFWVMKK
jgi:methylglutaconyl-CoA hydratase